MNVVLSKIGFDCRDADYASINVWEANSYSIPAIIHVGVVYPSNKRFSDDLKNLLKLSPEHLIDFQHPEQPLSWNVNNLDAFFS